MVTAIVVLAIYVSLGRVLSTNLRAYQDDVLAALNERVPFHIAADSLSGEWRSFTPEIVLSGLRLTVPGSDGDALDLTGGRVGLDVLVVLFQGCGKGVVQGLVALRRLIVFEEGEVGDPDKSELIFVDEAHFFGEVVSQVAQGFKGCP